MSAVSGSRSEYIGLLRDQLHAALQAGRPEILCADLDFADWPLNEPPLIEALTLWARPHYRLVLLAQRYDEVLRRHPRFVQWRRTWGHVVFPFTPLEVPPADHPGLLWSSQAVVEVLDRDSWRARFSDTPADLSRTKQALDALLQRSEPAFAATTLGL